MWVVGSGVVDGVISCKVFKDVNRLIGSISL